ncbi:PAS and ANTAR domain-containing protein [Nocardia sp. NPDC050712]|uniref:PAS and ANTAR domain-containing protein n=1 Tax=Nocardia sp. NPDC050712 TaxID=3155518 RepID=UPI0033C6AF1E
MGQLDPDSASVVERVIAGRPHSIGSFRFLFADQRWEWSDEVALLHGYEPGTVVPTTALLLSHKHPEDRAEVAHTLTAVTTTGEAFCSRHRIIDTAGEIHDVLVVGDQLLDDDGAVMGTSGYYIDVTHTLLENRRATLDEALPDLIEARAVIEQAKGVLMLVYGITPEQAFKVLQWRSQETNVKLRRVAELLVGAIGGLGGAPVGFRSRFDHLLLTMHEDPRRI